MLVPEAEGEEEEVDVVMTAALGSIGPRYLGQSVRSRGNGSGSSSSSGSGSGRLREAWSAEPCFVCVPERAMRRTKLFRPGQGPEVSTLGRPGRQAGTTKIDSGIRRWILAARVTQAGSPIASKASGTVMISEKAGYG